MLLGSFSVGSNAHKDFGCYSKIPVFIRNFLRFVYAVFVPHLSVGVRIEELTSYALHELIKAIYVDAPDKSSGKRRQHIHIQYDGLGFIPLNELLAQEKA